MVTQKKILVVEDNVINRAILKRLLSSDYEVMEAENGQEALEVLKEYKEGISLVLLDIAMPVMDGYTFLSIVKADPAYKAIPIIVTTQSDSEDDEVAALAHGAADFVAKPYEPQIILRRVANIIHLRETAAMINQFRYDRLTGLYSREYFYERIRATLREHPGEKYDIICSNVENFKLINDVLGVAEGDQILRGIADMYRKFVDGLGVYGRLTADQFGCMIKHRENYGDEDFARAIQAVTQLPNGKNLVIKWGIYTIEDVNISVEQMCDRALLAVRNIKGQYGTTFASYDDELRGKLLHEQAILDSMESALQEEQFFICLQPKYRLKDRTLAGAEALVRWQHPEWGLQSPAEFIPVFERNGFITKLDQFVWEKTCSVMHSWDEKGYPPVPVSVNVSRADIYNIDTIDILLDITSKYKIPTERLHLEITESAYTDQPDQIIETVSHLRKLGFIVEMDDFGAGYSSLNMLNQLPIDILKLDMKFIQNETQKISGYGILRFIMELARWMHLNVVAEGVETRTQYEYLQEIGCDYAQGYFLSKPISCQEFEQLMESIKDIAEKELEEEHSLSLQKILLVADQDADYCKGVRDIFSESYDIIEVESMKSLLSEIATHKGEIAALLLNTFFPGIRGSEEAEAARATGMWNIPVIVTGPRDPKLEEEALELGAADYASKPHSEKSLYQRVLRVVRLFALQKREKFLSQEVRKDHVTGVLNRRGLEAAMRSLRREDMPFTFCLFDLDNLKHINDTLGHMEGDRLIKSFSDILRLHTRDTDVLARFGGDEFIAIIKRMGNEAIAQERGEAICQALQKVGFSDGTVGTVSAGIIISEGDESIEELLDRVDLSLYDAKMSRRGHAVCGGRKKHGE